MFLFHLILLPKKPLFFPFHQCFPPRSVSLTTTGSFWLFGNSEISHCVFSPFRAPLRPQVRRSGRQCILTLAGEKTRVAWCTQEKTKETPFLGTEEDMKSPWWQIAGNIHHMTQWRNTSIKISQGIFQEWVYRFKGFMFHAFHAFLKVSFEMIV